jgi:rare lipoprotein A
VQNDSIDSNEDEKNNSEYYIGQTWSGEGSYYASEFHGRKTASGEIYDMYELTAAHRTLPFGTILEVENLVNGLKINVRINDRGPFKKGRIIDLSYQAAKKIDLIKQGVTKVRIKIIKIGDV